MDTDFPRRTCACGSNKERYELVDARGIFCSYVCEDCEQVIKSRYRPEIFKDSNYVANEGWDYDPIEDEKAREQWAEFITTH